MLFIVYAPVGFLLVVFRVFLALQAVLILVVVAEGVVKRLMLRVIFLVLGIAVTTSEFERRDRKAKILVGNKLSYFDYIALHLAIDCYTVSTKDEGSSPLTTVFPHHTFRWKDGDGLVTEARERPMFDEEGRGPISYAVQPECHPTNGCSVLLPFSSWPFALEQSVQPLALSATRFFGPRLTVAGSNGWMDLFWTLFSPITIFHIRMLPVVHKNGDTDSAEDFCHRVEQEIAGALGLTVSNIKSADLKKWLSQPPPPHPPAQATTIPQGPVITAAEFASLPQSYPSGIELMVQQVATVLPHVPHTIIRKDLLATRSVDVTVANILEGHVAFVPLPQGAPPTPPAKPSVSRPSSLQRHASLEERKKALVAEARRWYLEKRTAKGKRDSY